MKNIQRNRSFRLFLLMVLVFSFTTIQLFSGCAHTQKTTTTETTVTTDHPDTYSDQSTTTTTDTTQSNTEVKDEPRGVVGSLFHFIGSVIAFPFRVIGGALKGLFG